MNTTIMNNRATVLLPLLALASLAAFSQSTGLNYVKETLALDESGSNNAHKGSVPLCFFAMPIAEKGISRIANPDTQCV
jgi:hypothetical protein